MSDGHTAKSRKDRSRGRRHRKKSRSPSRPSRSHSQKRKKNGRSRSRKQRSRSTRSGERKAKGSPMARDVSQIEAKISAPSDTPDSTILVSSKGSQISWMLDVLNEVMDWDPIGLEENSGSAPLATSQVQPSVATHATGTAIRPGDSVTFAGGSVGGSVLPTGTSMPFLDTGRVPLVLNGGTQPLIGIGAPALPPIGVHGNILAGSPLPIPAPMLMMTSGMPGKGEMVGSSIMGKGGLTANGMINHSGVTGIGMMPMASVMQGTALNYPDMQSGLTSTSPIAFGVAPLEPIRNGCWS